MGSALNLAAKSSQFVIQEAKGLPRNVHARTRQSAPLGIPRASWRRNAGPRGQKSLGALRGEAEPTDSWALFAINQHPFHAAPSSCLFCFFLNCWRPRLLRLSKGPGTGIMAPPHPPRQAVLGTGDNPTKCGSPPLLPVSPVSRGFFSLSPWKSRPQTW